VLRRPIETEQDDPAPGTGAPRARGASVDAAEIDRFAALAADWWDPAGAMRPLHRLNPVRIGYIRDQATAHFGRDARAERPLDGLRLADIGCGAGLLCEPMARLGATVTGIDAAGEAIAVARGHADGAGLAIDYRVAAAEELARDGARFDMVLAMEILEHVADRDLFLDALAALVAPGGLMVVATINRTAKAWLLAIVGAEYILGWLPRGTHRFESLVRPSEVAAALRRGGLVLHDLTGVVYAPVGGRWTLDARDTDVNYMMAATRPA